MSKEVGMSRKGRKAFRGGSDPRRSVHAFVRTQGVPGDPRRSAAGQVDVVFATHRILQKNVRFREFGLPACRRRGAALRRRPQGTHREAQSRAKSSTVGWASGSRPLRTRVMTPFLAR
jgi:hypothetical protein